MSDIPVEQTRIPDDHINDIVNKQINDILVNQTNFFSFKCISVPIVMWLLTRFYWVNITQTNNISTLTLWNYFSG